MLGSGIITQPVAKGMFLPPLSLFSLPYLGDALWEQLIASLCAWLGPHQMVLGDKRSLGIAPLASEEPAKIAQGSQRGSREHSAAVRWREPGARGGMMLGGGVSIGSPALGREPHGWREMPRGARAPGHLHQQAASTELLSLEENTGNPLSSSASPSAAQLPIGAGGRRKRVILSTDITLFLSYSL